MGGFRRFLLFVFSLAGLLCLAALALPWFGLFADELGVLEQSEAYVVAVQGCLAMTAAWLVWSLLRALFSRRDDSIPVMSVDGGAITVARDAVASQASHIVEALGVGTASDVDVRAGRRGPVHVRVRVTPYESIDVTSEAPVLHEGLVAGLTAMCGDRLGAVDVEFLEPVRPISLVEAVTDDGSEGSAAAGSDAAPAGAADQSVAAAASEEGPAAATPSSEAPGSPASADSGEIVIPMRGERGEQNGR